MPRSDNKVKNKIISNNNRVPKNHVEKDNSNRFSTIAFKKRVNAVFRQLEKKFTKLTDKFVKSLYSFNPEDPKNKPVENKNRVSTQSEDDNVSTSLKKVNGVYENGTVNGTLYLDFWDNDLRINNKYCKIIVVFFWVLGLSFLYYKHITDPIMIWASRPWCDLTSPYKVYIDLYHLLIIDYFTFWSLLLVLFFNLWFTAYVWGGSYVFLVIQNLIRTNSSSFFNAYDWLMPKISYIVDLYVQIAIFSVTAVHDFLKFISEIFL